MIGERIGNYRITRLLAEGGMGAVYLAEHPAIGRRVAVKVLLPEVAGDQEVVRRFFNEARAAHSIRHPGIVEILDFGTLASGTSYIIMEFLEGESLGTRLKRQSRLPVGDAVEIVAQAALALDAAHSQGIVHRDLKPDNLFLVRDPRAPDREIVKVLDFGIAKLGQGPNGAGSFKTRTGTLMGTLYYMSPEQCLGTKMVDHRSDVYALGVILHEMLSGVPPFVSDGQGELIYMHISVPPPALPLRELGIPRALEAEVLRALAKNANQRHQSMAEFGRAIRSSLHGAHAATGTDPGVGPTGSVSRPTATAITGDEAIGKEIGSLGHGRRLGRVAIVGALLVVAGGAGVAIKMRVSPAPEPVTPGGAEVPMTPPVPVAAARTLAPPAPIPLATSEPKVATILVSVTSTPSGARIVREKDQAVIGVTPFKESWPIAAGTERLRLEARGYLPESVLVPLDRGADLRFTLKKATKRPDASPSWRSRARPARPAPREPIPL